MRTSPETARTHARTAATLKDERLASWHPDRISDRKLIELANRLEKVQRLGDAFADIALASPLHQRLDRLREPAAPAIRNIA